MMREFKRALLMFIAFSIATGLIYPLAFTGLSRLVFPKQAEGSLVPVNGKTVGSNLIGQMFTKPEYFHGRPSSADYDAANSGASNMAPSNKKFLDQVRDRVEQVRRENNLAPDTPVPPDLVLASGSGLDPHISPQAALLQVARVAKARSLPETEVEQLVQRHVERPQFRLLGQPRVNVLKLNLALDALAQKRTK